MEAVAPIPAEILVATVPGQRDGDVLAGALAEAVRRNGRAVGEGLVVEARERVDEIQIVALDTVDEMPCAVSLRDLRCVARFVESGVGERNRARIDRRGRGA